MKDEVHPYPFPLVQSYAYYIQEIQKATASEPLTLEEEHNMQQSWRLDHDKLTFIVCHAPAMQNKGTPTAPIKRCVHDAPDKMIGDVNLFLYEDDSDCDSDAEPSSTATTAAPRGRQPVLGELEIMIASPAARGRGLAYATLLAFLGYISAHLAPILEEYRSGSDEKSERYLRYLRVKIDQHNVRSLGLFGKLGFQRVGAVNYFGEVEMRLQGRSGDAFGGLELAEQDVGKVVAYIS
jgi:RimJ/RimL family protein N-acetyltransferase